KDSANEWKSKGKSFFSLFSRMQPILYKDSANEPKSKGKSIFSLLFQSAAWLIIMVQLVGGIK
ncbi:MAG: hypothetical protein KBH76_02140, partial [Prevotella sp.]